MNIHISPSPIQGSVMIPPSKSLTHRYYMLAALTNGVSIINNPLTSDDTNNTLEAIHALGTQVVEKNNQVYIEGKNGAFQATTDRLFLGDSGTSARLLIGLCALSKHPITIDGSERLRERPYKDLLVALKQQGIQITFHDGDYHLPLTIQGGALQGGRIEISGKTSSQFISALLQIAPFAANDTEIIITDELKSKSYIDLTIQAMQAFNIQVETQTKTYRIKANQQYKSCSLNVEGDYSSASYFIMMSFLTGKKITIKNLNSRSKQADTAVLDDITLLGGTYAFSDEGLTINRGDQIKTAEIDISNCPDIALTVAMAGPFTQEYLLLKGTNRLVDKESNRALAISSNLKRLGARVESGDDWIKIYKSDLHTANIETYNDHRVAMSFAILGLLINDGIIIQNAQVVSKSYPDFWKDLRQLRVQLQEV